MNRREAISALVALPAVSSIAVADVKPTDVIVVECDELLSIESMARIKAKVSEVWPDRKVVVFDKKSRMRIVRDSQ